MPLDGIFVELYEHEMNCMRFIAKADNSGGEIQDILLPLPNEAKSAAVEMKTSVTDDPGNYVLLENEPDDISLYIFEKPNLPVSSIPGLPLIIEVEPFGAYFLTAEGLGRYTREHADLLAMLRDPFYNETIQGRPVKTMVVAVTDSNSTRSFPATVQLQWKFWQSGKTRADTANVRQQISALKSNIEGYRNQVLEEVRGSILDCRVAGGNIETAAAALEQAKENWRITALQYQEQTALASDVLDARTFLSQADANYCTAKNKKKKRKGNVHYRIRKYTISM